MAEGMALALEKKDQVSATVQCTAVQCCFVTWVLISFWPLLAGMDGEDGRCGKGQSLNPSLVTSSNMLFCDENLTVFHTKHGEMKYSAQIGCFHT